MNLYGIISYYDESPVWLAACVSSMGMIGVDHVIAVDGAYHHYDGDARSPVEQSDAITLAAESQNMGSTVVRPEAKRWTEPQKRTFCFQLAHLLGEPYRDWCVILDGDDLIVDGDLAWKQELAELDEDTYCAVARLEQTIDPFDENGKYNTERTPEIYRRLPSPTKFGEYQSRAWRIVDDMRCVVTHYNFYGKTRDGRDVNLRPTSKNDYVPGAFETEVYKSDRVPTIQHRDPWRTQHRRDTKAAYYALRDELGLERV